MSFAKGFSAKEADAADPLRHFAERFCFPETADGSRPLYFTGNSLGLMPKRARDYVNQELEDWSRLAVEGHLKARNPWLPYHEFLSEPMARVVGAKPEEVVVMNGLTVNLHLMMVSFYRPTEQRFKIVIERGAFPSDRYAVESQILWHRNRLGLDWPIDSTPHSALVELAPRDGEATLRTEDIVEWIEREGESVAMLLLGSVNYYTGQAFDIPAITEAGHRKGCIVAFDCAHAAGNLELRLHDWDVDFAAWCSYKYLNGGPGAVAGVFVHEKHARAFDLPRFAGWWGTNKDTRFLMRPEFECLPGAEGWQLSNPPILQMAALRASLEIFDEAEMPKLREKSRQLTAYLESLIDQIGDPRLSIITPRDPDQRGCQLSIRVTDKSIYQKLQPKGVFADWREPDVIRIAPVPLYNSFEDVYRFSEILKECLA
jgi:kynureninase